MNKISAAIFRHHFTADQLFTDTNACDRSLDFFIGMSMGFRRMAEIFGTAQEVIDGTEQFGRELYRAAIDQPWINHEVTRLAAGL